MKIPLSPEQLVILEQQSKSSRATPNIPISARFIGFVDNEAVSAAVRDLIDRHAILRTIFPESNGIPQPEILEAAAAPELEIKQVAERGLANVFNQAVDYRFDLSREVPVRVHLFSTSPWQQTLLFVFNRIAFDTRSLNPLMNDLIAFYSARFANRPSDLPALAMQYADYANTRRRASGKRKFSKNAPESESADNEYRGIVPVRINPGIHGRLLAFSKEAGVSVASTLYAGFAVFISHLGLGNKAFFAVLHSERDRQPELLPLIGNFETILPMEINVKNNTTFSEVVGYVARSYKAAYEGKKQSGNQQTDEADDAAIRFRTLFRLKPVGVETFKFPMLNVRVSPVPVTETGFELIFDLTERIDSDGKPQGIEGSVIFDRNVFAPRHIPIRLNLMMTLLNQGIQNPDAHVNTLHNNDKQTAWARSALAPECKAHSPERVPVTRMATVYDNGRQERVPLTDSFAASDITVATGWQQGYVAYQDALQCRLAGIWEVVLGVSRIGVRDCFTDLGGDTGKARRVISAINEVYRKQFPVSLMCGGVTVESLADAICRELPFEPVTEIQPRLPESKPPLFFVHSDVFGNGLYTIELSQYLGTDRPLLSFNPHGLNGHDLPDSIEKMAEDNLNVLCQMCPDGDFWLGGYCNGALIAYEMARLLACEGRKLQTPLLLVDLPPVDYIGEATPRPAYSVPTGSKVHKIWILSEILRLTGIYKPQKYDGKVVVIQSYENPIKEMEIQSIWKGIANDIEVYYTPGDHVSCIGRHIANLSAILKRIMG